MSGENLIFCARGPGPGTVMFPDEPDRTWDLVEILWHPDMIADHRAGVFRTNATTVLYDRDRTKRKFVCFAEWWADGAAMDYEAVLLADDDLSPAGCTWSDVFALFHASNLAIAQPALTADSTKVWPVTHQDPTCRYRTTDFVEVMAPIFRRDQIEPLLPFFLEEKNGWGLEALWHARFAPLGILDATPIRHVRPIGSAHQTTGLVVPAERQAEAFRRKHGLQHQNEGRGAYPPEVPMMTIALAVSSDANNTDRAVSLSRLSRELGFAGDEWDVPNGPLALRRFPARETYTTASEDKWRWLEDSGAEWGLHLDDRARVAPGFWRILRAMLSEARSPSCALYELEGGHAAATLFHLTGDPWFTSADGVLGNVLAGVAFWRQFREWRGARLRESAYYAASENEIIAAYCLDSEQPIWTPTQTFVDHDPELRPGPRAPVRWDTGKVSLELLQHPEHWRPVKRVPHVGRVDDRALAVLKHHVKGTSDTLFARAWADNGVREITRAKIEARILLPPEAVPTVVVATPSRGAPALEYMETVLKCAMQGAVELVRPYEHARWWAWRDDIVRVRSRMLALFLKSGASHLWFLDDDVSCDPVVLKGMIDAQRDFVVCPYPVKRLDWESVEKDDGRSAEARALKYDNIQPTSSGDITVNAQHCVEIGAAGLGCALLTRKGLESFLAHLRELDVPDLFFSNPIAGKRTCFPFKQRELIIDGEPELLSEDLSFCSRWRESGRSIWMYVGPGAPATHHGTFAFRGLRESLTAGTKKDAA